MGQIPNPEQRFAEPCQVEMLRTAQLPETKNTNLSVSWGWTKADKQQACRGNVTHLSWVPTGTRSSTRHRACFFYKASVKTQGCSPTTFLNLPRSRLGKQPSSAVHNHLLNIR